MSDDPFDNTASEPETPERIDPVEEEANAKLLETGGEEIPVEATEEEAVVIPITQGDPGDENDAQPEPEEEIEEEQTQMAWEDVLDAPLIRQVARIGWLSNFSQNQLEYATAMIEEGIDPNLGGLEAKLDAREEVVLSFALNLVGFFMPGAADIATDILERLVQAKLESLDQYTEEMKDALREADAVIAEKRMAASLNISVEDLRAMKRGEEPSETPTEPGGEVLN
jgi:hypothetical protein